MSCRGIVTAPFCADVQFPKLTMPQSAAAQTWKPAPWLQVRVCRRPPGLADWLAAAEQGSAVVDEVVSVWPAGF